MIYYELHLGDYLRDTAHLSMLEDGAYRRLLDVYYRTEKPLPTDVKEVCRLVRAVSKGDREAVKAVLNEFFKPTDDGWRQPRADAEIARYHAKVEKARGSAKARWDNVRTHSERNANASPEHSERNADGMLSKAPSSKHQSSDKNLRSSSVGDLSPSSSDTGPDGLKNREELRRAVANIGRLPT